MLELLRAASNALVRAEQTVEMLEVYVEICGGQAAGVKLLRCTSGWVLSHDDLHRLLLEPVPSSMPPQLVDVREFLLT